MIIHITLGLAVFVFAANALCPDGWEPYIGTNNMCIKGYPIKLGWFDAYEYCRMYSDTGEGNLVSVHNAFQNVQISNIANTVFGSLNYWIGLSDQHGHGYNWTDFSSVDYTNWAPGYPVNDTDKTVVFVVQKKGNRWMSSGDLFGIKTKHYFVCEQFGTTASTVPPTTAAVRVSTIPTQAPDLKSKYDVIIMLDSSETLTPEDYKTIAAYLGPIILKMPIAQDRTRFILGTYADEAMMFNNDFTEIKDADDFLKQLQIIALYGYVGRMGNNVQSIFEQMQPSWWRANAQPVLVFFSSVGWDQSDPRIPFPDPTNSAKTFLRAGGKIIPIGFGQYANKDQLQAMGGMCTKMATDIEVVKNNVVQWITSAISHPDPSC